MLVVSLMPGAIMRLTPAPLAIARSTVSTEAFCSFKVMGFVGRAFSFPWSAASDCLKRTRGSGARSCAEGEKPWRSTDSFCQCSAKALGMSLALRVAQPERRSAAAAAASVA